MFTGLVEEMGEVYEVSDRGGVLELHIRARPEFLRRLAPGGSIAVDGICFTAVTVETETFAVQAVPETVRRTTAGAWKPGRRVNLELPLAAGAPLGGHWVQGHVDGTTVLESAERGRDTCVHVYRLPEAWRAWIVEKGSIALNGVSLTVAGLTPATFSVALIPVTLAKTNLGELQPGDLVNVEVDVLAKYIYHLVQPYLERAAREASRSVRSQTGK